MNNGLVNALFLGIVTVISPHGPSPSKVSLALARIVKVPPLFQVCLIFTISPDAYSLVQTV